jgi:ankyrin repeat protein
MSGPEQRQAAIDGDFDSLKDYIIKRCNPCSTDEYGLSALHYGVWNGHVECVKLLVCNTLGVDTNGKRGKSLELKSCMGYTGTSTRHTNVGMPKQY